MTESVWDYPRPPRVEPSARRVRVVHGGATIADTTRAVRDAAWYYPDPSPAACTGRSAATL